MVYNWAELEVQIHILYFKKKKLTIWEAENRFLLKAQQHNISKRLIISPAKIISVHSFIETSLQIFHFRKSEPYKKFSFKLSFYKRGKEKNIVVQG